LSLTGPAATGGGGYGATSHVVIDRYAIWEQMLTEGWRHLRDGFYDKGMLGVDWNEVLARYKPRVREAGTPEEFTELMREMLGELGASHLGYYTGESSREGPAEATAGFGTLFDEAFPGPGWRVSKVLLNSPADQPASKLFVDDVITKLNGAVIAGTEDRAKLLRNLAGQVVTLTVTHAAETPPTPVEPAPVPDKSLKPPDMPPAGERTVQIKPAPEGSLGQLRYEQWVQDNRSYVYAHSGARIGYQHIQGMDGPSLEKFRRELFTESQGKSALIIDVRFNGGGGIHEQLTDMLDRRPFGYSALRDAPRAMQPEQRWEGPVVVLINPNSYSDAEIFPHIMQELGLGTLLGEPTGGNVIGTYDFPLLDGSGFRLPGAGWWLLNGKDMEGNGAQPDVLVRFDPAAGAAGRDNQLEAAVQYLQEKLEKK
jgi:tricorn protease